MYEFWVVIVPRTLAALLLIAATVWGLRWARYASMRHRYQTQKTRIAELEQHRTSARNLLAALVVWRDLDAMPAQYQEQLQELLNANPRKSATS